MRWGSLVLLACACQSPPGAPTAAAATGGDAHATVTWVAPTDTNGSPLTGFLIESVPPGAMALAMFGATRATVTGLTNGQAVAFTVKAVNRAGASAPSAPTN